MRPVEPMRPRPGSLSPRATLALALLAACTPAAPAPPRPAPAPPRPPLPALGTPADVHTTPGTYDGYEVDATCDDAGTRGVRGLGARQLPPRDDPRTFDAWADALQRETTQALAPSVMGVGFGVGCHAHERAFRVYVPSYREIDRVVDELGAFARARDLGVRFLVLPAPRVVPL